MFRGPIFVLGVAAVLLACPHGAVSQTLEEGAPKLAEHRYRTGRVLYKQGKFAAAVKEFQTAFDLFPDSAKLAFNMARTCERLDRMSEAVGHYERYLALAPSAKDRGRSSSWWRR